MREKIAWLQKVHFSQNLPQKHTKRAKAAHFLPNKLIDTLYGYQSVCCLVGAALVVFASKLTTTTNPKQNSSTVSLWRLCCQDELPLAVAVRTSARESLNDTPLLSLPLQCRDGSRIFAPITLYE